MNNIHPPCIAIIDFGGQYTQLIARRMRGFSVYAIILPHTVTMQQIVESAAEGVILSGGPSSVQSKDAPRLSFNLAELVMKNIPVLGLCYGLQYIVKELKGEVLATKRHEYGGENVFVSSGHRSSLLKDIPKKLHVWMSHSDSVAKIPNGFEETLRSSNALAGLEDVERGLYALQFHPEVEHTEHGNTILKNFACTIVGLKPEWKPENSISSMCAGIVKNARNRRVLVAVSGGVDSTVLAVLLNRAIKNNAVPVFVDNGLLRLGEAEKIVTMFQNEFKVPLKVLNEQKFFLNALKNVNSPEEKRRVIGRCFVEVFMPLLRENDVLAQGTLYTDVVESVKTSGPSHTIKTHHNRVEEILSLQKQNRLIEPFAHLFKDEVRAVGIELGISKKLIMRHPFPGPGLGVRVLGEVHEEYLNILREADAIYLDELKKSGYYEKLWQCFCVFLPIKSVGVVGDQRHYGYVIALRAVHATDGMTADFELFDKNFVAKVSARIIGEVAQVSRVVLDVSQKPPSTIEWE